MKAAKLVATRRKGGEVLLVRRRRDGRWMFPGGKRKRGRESLLRCLAREISEELPELRLAGCRLWRKLNGKNSYSGRKMSDAVFLPGRVRGRLTIGAPKEIDRVAWRRPFRLTLTPTSRQIRDMLIDEGILRRR
jgi:8-oxo-dGTP diphosphatase